MKRLQNRSQKITAMPLAAMLVDVRRLFLVWPCEVKGELRRASTKCEGTNKAAPISHPVGLR